MTEQKDSLIKFSVANEISQRMEREQIVETLQTAFNGTQPQVELIFDWEDEDGRIIPNKKITGAVTKLLPHTVVIQPDDQQEKVAVPLQRVRNAKVINY